MAASQTTRLCQRWHSPVLTDWHKLPLSLDEARFHVFTTWTQPRSVDDGLSPHRIRGGQLARADLQSNSRAFPPPSVALKFNVTRQVPDRNRWGKLARRERHRSKIPGFPVGGLSYQREWPGSWHCQPRRTTVATATSPVRIRRPRPHPSRYAGKAFTRFAACAAGKWKSDNELLLHCVVFSRSKKRGSKNAARPL